MRVGNQGIEGGVVRAGMGWYKDRQMLNLQRIFPLTPRERNVSSAGLA
jgi:hypothetical protein